MRTWNSVAIIGVGLIGGSIGLALRARSLARRVIGIGRRPASLQVALDRGCITEMATSIAAGVADAELVVVCTPVEVIAQHVAEASRHCPRGAIITDAGSTKVQVVTTAAAAVHANQAGKTVAFVGSHPLAGSEKSGPEAATADLFVDRVAIVTPTTQSNGQAVRVVEEFWQSLGSRVLRMSPEEHDAAVAHTSHLPHLIASALAAGTPAELLPLTATGWQDTTRIAAGDVELWRQIFLANRGPTLLALADFETVLARFRTALTGPDEAALAELLAEGKRRRDALGS